MRSVIRENVRIAPYTTIRIGGVARYFADIDRPDQLPNALQFAEEKNLPIFVLGGGSNVVMADAGFPGVILHIVNKGITFHKAKKDSAMVTVAAGEEWDAFVQQCVARDLAGLECLSGIPGYVGGTPIQNVGAYGQEVSETIFAVRVFDRHTNAIVELSNQDCRFSYRASIFNTTARDRYIVLEVTYKLRPHAAPTLHYADLQKHFARHQQPPTLQEVREAVLTIRASKGMVIVPSDPDCQSAGSFFKNPIVSRETFDQIEAATSEPVPNFPAANDQIKIPAAWLIEKAGFPKGYERGRVAISSKHNLALVNRSQATARELMAFVTLIQNKVQERFGIALTPEPVMVGVETTAAISLAPPQPKPAPPAPSIEPPPLSLPPINAPRGKRKAVRTPLKSERKKWFE